jgi:hypothetical protein
MENIKVTFHGQDNRKLQFDCMFKSETAFNRFIKRYQHYGGFTRFDYDIWEDNCQEKLPVLTNCDKSFILVYQNLYEQYA